MRSRTSPGGLTPAAQACLLEELDRAEASKATLDLAQGRETMEAFALQVFDGAEAADRSGQSDANTASHFYMASLFVDACAQFYGGELPPDLFEKSKYAKYRAMHIRDCLKRGAIPDAPLASEALAGDAVAAPADAPAAFPAASPALAAPYPSAALAAPYPSAAASAAAPSARAPAAAPAAGGATLAPSVAALQGNAPARTLHVDGDACKKLQFASAALDFGDVATARGLLVEALTELEAR